MSLRQKLTDQLLASNWELQSNDGTNVVAYNRKSGRTLSTTLINFNELVKASVPVEKTRMTLIKTATPAVIGSSGTVDADGIITLDVALPAVYTGAWIYLPADAIVNGLAGWYYAVFSTTAVGQVYNKFSKAGMQFVPYTPDATESAALVAAVGSNAAYVQTVTALNMMSYLLPGGTLGANGVLDIKTMFTMNNDATAKTTTVAFGASTLVTDVNANVAHSRDDLSVQNRGLQSKQLVSDNTGVAVPVYTSVDTNADVVVKVTGLSGSVSDFVVMESLELSLTV